MEENKRVIERLTEMYQRDTTAMILVFAQWCINNDLNPLAVYKEAYLEQDIPPALTSMVELTVPKEEAGEISLQTLLNVLIAFDNDRLAAIVQEKAKQR
jgi:hypothetical protein